MFQFLQAVRGCKSNDKPPTGVDSRKLEPEPKPEPKPEPDHPGWIVLATRVCRQFVCHFISFSLPGLILVQKPFSKHFPITQAWAANGLLKLQVGVTAIFRWCSPQTCDQLFPDFHTLCVTHVRRHVSAAVSQQPPAENTHYFQRLGRDCWRMSRHIQNRLAKSCRWLVNGKRYRQLTLKTQQKMPVAVVWEQSCQFAIFRMDSFVIWKGNTGKNIKHP